MEQKIFKPVEVKGTVDAEYQRQIYDYLTDIQFDWHFMDDPTFEKTNDPRLCTPSFANLLYYEKHEQNPHFDFFKPLLEAVEKSFDLKIQRLMRMRAGFLLNTKHALPSMPYKHNAPHRDYDEEHFVVVYYANVADGETVVYRETQEAEKYYPLHKCMPEQGKMLLFNGWHYHASTCPKVFAKRLAININFTAIKNG